MKRIIYGKRYDTETAERIAHDSESNPSDFRYYNESLYRTKRGAWFVAGEGGALSSWAQPAEGGGSCYGEGIRPLSEDEARDWLEHAEETEALEKFFSIEDA